MRRLGALAAVVLAGSCGGDDGSLPRCQVQLGSNASLYTVPFAARVTATILEAGSGVASYAWTVTDPTGAALDFTPSTPIASSVDFDGSAAGSYRVRVVVDYSTASCSDEINVVAAPPGATQRSYRLRFVPVRPGDPPAQESANSFPVLSGIPALDLGATPLGAGVDAGGTIVDEAGAPVSAFLRLDPQGTLPALEIPIGADGAWSARLADATYEVTIAPYGGLPALRPPSEAAAALDDFVVTAGDLVSGHVRDAGGGAVAGARVSVRAGALSPMVVTTDAGGAFQARLRAAEGPLALTIVPPAGSGLAEAELAEAVTVTAGTTLEASLPAVTTRAFTTSIVDSAGDPLPGAVVTFRSTSLPSGSVAVGGVARGLRGVGRAVLIADGAGRISSVLPRGAYQVVVEPPASSADVATVTTVDLAAAAPVSLASGTGRDVSVTASPAGSRVTAISRGVGGVGAGRATVATADGGVATLRLATGIEHDLIVDPPVGLQALRARVRRTLDATATTLAVELPSAVRLDGELVYPFGAAGNPGIRVEAVCVDCPDGPRVTAESVTGGGGIFHLAVPEPGLE